ncbi:nucleotide exchange factor GrpE [bacterium]|nr:nucleotide exchange factor GrpE [bacterium]
MNDEEKEIEESEKDEKQDWVEDDLVFEADEDADGGGAVVKKLREKLHVCQKEKEEYLTGWQRAKADYVNARKDEEKTRGEFAKMANKEVLLDMIAVADSFEQAQANREAWEKIDKNWRVGVEYIYSQLLSTLERHGLAQVNPVGEKFDPKIHTSVRSVPTEKEEDDEKIVAVIQKGYSLGGTLIRSPKVEVAVWGK